MKTLSGIILAVSLALAAVALAEDSSTIVNIAPPSKVDRTVDTARNASATYSIGGVVQPTKANYSHAFWNMTALIVGSGNSAVKNFTNFMHENDPSVHPYPSQVRIKQVTIVASANTTGRLFLFARDTFRGASYLDDTYLTSINFGSLTQEPGGSNYVQDVQCDVPFIDLDGTNEFHWVFKNTGATATRASFRVIYE
ncbi:MAG TPA: hypothetical protein VGK71_01185 [Nitrospirota bacterium]